MYFERTELVREAIRKAHEEAEKQQQAATVTDEYNGSRIETVYFKKNNAVWARIIVDGTTTSENRVYEVKGEKPYTRSFGKRWYLDSEHKEAMAAVL